MKNSVFLPLFMVGALIAIILAGCGDNSTFDQPDSSMVSVPPDASSSTDSTFYDGQALGELSAYAQQVNACRQANPDLPDEWERYLLDREQLFQLGYYRSLDEHPLVKVRVECWRGQCVPYIPGSACADEESHMALLKALAEKVFPRWIFEFSTEMPAADADIVLHLAFDGYSSTLGNDIYVVYESIFVHEFLHWVGNFSHHYCGNNVFDTTSCGPVLPEGEGECLMSRNSVLVGKAEACLLGIVYPDDLPAVKAKIDSIIVQINGCYPSTWRLAASLHLTEPMPFEGMHR